MAIRLWFDLTAVLALAEHAAAAARQAPTDSQRTEGQAPAPALWWITFPGQGSYLVSNGLPGPAAFPGPAGRGEARVYATGYGPGTTGASLTRAGLPTDGFARLIPVTEPVATNLLAALRLRHWVGHTRLTLDHAEPAPALGTAQPHPYRSDTWWHLPL